jgi:hypothetical protein
MKKIIVLASMLVVSSVVFSQTNQNSNNKTLKGKKEVLKEDPNKKGCPSCPKSDNEFGQTESIDINFEIKKLEVVLPSDFPSYVDTGNPKQDLANFHEAKQEWIKNNPENLKKIKHINSK